MKTDSSIRRSLIRNNQKINNLEANNPGISNPEVNNLRISNPETDKRGIDNLTGSRLRRDHPTKRRMGIRAGKNLFKGVSVAILSLSILLNPLSVIPVQAEEKEQTAKYEEEIIELSQIMVAGTELEAKAAPDEAADTVISYHTGDNIYVTGETQNGWYRVRYQDVVGYIQTEYAAEIELDVEALNEEFAVEEVEGKLVVEEVERQRTEAKRSKIWGAVIVLMVTGIFATGVISAVKSGKKDEVAE